VKTDSLAISVTLGGTVDCMAVIKGGPKSCGVASPRERGHTGEIIRSSWVLGGKP
jgi:hypothetical protein